MNRCQRNRGKIPGLFILVGSGWLTPARAQSVAGTWEGLIRSTDVETILAKSGYQP